MNIIDIFPSITVDADGINISYDDLNLNPVAFTGSDLLLALIKRFEAIGLATLATPIGINRNTLRLTYTITFDLKLKQVKVVSEAPASPVEDPFVIDEERFYVPPPSGDGTPVRRPPPPPRN